MDAPLPSNLVPAWELFLATDAERPAGLDLYPDIFTDPVVFPLQRQREMAEMVREVRKVNPTTILDIGSDKGAGVYTWLKAFPALERMIACEIRGTPYRHLFERTFAHVEFCWIEGSSYDSRAVERVDQFIGGDMIDAAFLDGDKSAFHKDFDRYRGLMQPDGIMLMHDIRDPGPRDAWEIVTKRGYRTRHILDVRDSEEAAEREAAGVPPTGPHEGWLRHWRGKSCSVGVIYLGG